MIGTARYGKLAGRVARQRSGGRAGIGYVQVWRPYADTANIRCLQQLLWPAICSGTKYHTCGRVPLL